MKICIITKYKEFNLKKMRKNYNIAKKMKEVFSGARNAHIHISKLKPKQKISLEKNWDIEHAYYSSSLEGSRVDKRDFEKMAKKVA